MSSASAVATAALAAFAFLTLAWLNAREAEQPDRAPTDAADSDGSRD